MLQPHLQRPDMVSDLRAQWRAQPCLRIESFLRPELASALLDALRVQAFSLMATVSANLSFQYWNLSFQPDQTCDHVLCEFGRWLWTDGAAWLSSLTELELGPPADRMLQSSLYTKGCYLDPHNDYDGARQVAYIIGLTPADEPRDRGGQLEFLRADDQGAQVVERRSPGWNTLDVFDVRQPVRLHRVPMVTEPLERRAIAGWLYQRSA